MDKTPFKEYAALKLEEKRIISRLLEIKPLVKEEMAKAGAEKVPSEFGTFTLKPVPVWKFSPAVEKAEEEVAELKAAEKADGTATSEPRYDLFFTAPKADTAE